MPAGTSDTGLYTFPDYERKTLYIYNNVYRGAPHRFVRSRPLHEKR